MGIIQTGYINDTIWCYSNIEGTIVTCWLNCNGSWYFFNANSSMAYNTIIDGLKLDEMVYG